MMHSHNSAVSAYRVGATQVHPMVAVVKLFDEVLRRIRMTIRDTEARKMEDAYINISRASQILRGLAGNLRHEAGADMAETLQNAYTTNMIAMHTSFGKPDAVERYNRIMGGLIELRNAFAGIAGMAEIPELAPQPVAVAEPATPVKATPPARSTARR